VCAGRRRAPRRPGAPAQTGRRRCRVGPPVASARAPDLTRHRRNDPVHERTRVADRARACAARWSKLGPDHRRDARGLRTTQDSRRGPSRDLDEFRDDPHRSLFCTSGPAVGPSRGNVNDRSSIAMRSVTVAPQRRHAARTLPSDHPSAVRSGSTDSGRESQPTGLPQPER
jgi:hypothetical protein